MCVFALTGCAPHITQVYSPSSKNIMTLRDLSTTTKNKLSVGKFEGDDSKINCRGAKIAPPNNMTFASYLKNALTEELMLANLYDENSSLQISGNLKELEVECAVGTGKWNIEMELIPKSGKPFVIKKSYDFEGAYMGRVVISNAQQSFVPATQEAINALLKSPEFKSYIKKEAN